MDKRAQIEQLIQKTLDQFDHPDTLPPNPYLYSRIQQRLESESTEGRMFPAFIRTALLGALVALNVLVSYWYLTGAEQYGSSDTRQELLNVLASDLNMVDDQNDLSVNE